MARTFRDKKNDFDRTGWFGTKAKGGRRMLDKDVDDCNSNKSYRTDGISVKPDYDDMRGGHTRGKAERIAGKNAVKRGLRDYHKDLEDDAEELTEHFREAYGDDDPFSHDLDDV